MLRGQEPVSVPHPLFAPARQRARRPSSHSCKNPSRGTCHAQLVPEFCGFPEFFPSSGARTERESRESRAGRDKDRGSHERRESRESREDVRVLVLVWQVGRASSCAAPLCS